MKKFLTFIVIMIILVGACFLAWHFFSDQITALFQKGKDKVDVLTGDKVEITIYEFYEEADSADYKQSSKTKKVAVEPGKPYTYDAPTVDHFTLITISPSVLSLDSAQKGDVLQVYYKRNTVSVTFDGGSAPLKEGQPATKDFKYGQTIRSIDYPQYENPGYKVGNSNVQATDNLTIHINWVEKINTLTINLADGCEITEEGYQRVGNSNTYQKSFRYADSFSLPIPTSETYTFQHYELANEEVISGVDHYDGDLTVFATFTETLYSITFVSVFDEKGNLMEDAFYPAITKQPTKKVSAPRIDPTNQIPGYGLTWYTTDDVAYVFDYMPNHDVELYGKWELDTGVSFLGSTPDDSIESFDELVAAYDYIYFTYNTTGIQFTVNYPYEDLQAEFQKIATTDASTYHGNGKILASFVNNKITLKMEADAREYEAQKHAPACETQVHPYGLYVAPTTGRDEAYNDFYIEKLTNTYPVQTTNQLLFVAEHGYKPICMVSSPALTAYNKAKEILRSYVSDEMSDFEKAEAIFNYLVLNVQYDNNVLTLTNDITDPWYNYDAYFIEGVLNYQKSVCDGIAKTYSLLCNMEGIPCVEVSGNGHAWCKVKINNNWYVVDATHGNTQISGTTWSIMDHAHFLMSDTEKATLGYTTTSYSNIKCNHSFNYFAYKELMLGSNSINLVVKTASDLALIIKKSLADYPNPTNVSIDLYYDSIFDFESLWTLACAEVRTSYPSFKTEHSTVHQGTDPVYKIIYG